MKFTIINDGVFFRKGTCGEPMSDAMGLPVRTRQEQADLQAPAGMTAVLDWPDQPLGIDENLIVSLGSELVLMLPENSIVNIAGQEFVMDGSGSMEITMQTDGEYELRIAPPFPYEPHSGRVVVE